MNPILPTLRVFPVCALLALTAHGQSPAAGTAPQQATTPAAGKSAPATPPDPMTSVTYRWQQHRDGPGLREAEMELMIARTNVQRANVGTLAGVDLREAELQLLRAEGRIQELLRLAPMSLTVGFRGGSLKSFVEGATKDGRVTLDIISADSTDDLEVPLPAFTLRNAPLSTVVGVLEELVAARGFTLTPTGDNSNPNSRIAVLRRDAIRAADAQRANQPDLASLQLTDYLFENQTIDAIVDAIRTAWALDPRHEAAALKLQYHPGTRILLVSGPVPAGDIANGVVAGLRKKPAARP